MVFGRKKEELTTDAVEPQCSTEARIVLFAPPDICDSEKFRNGLSETVAPLELAIGDTSALDTPLLQNATAVVSIFQDVGTLDAIMDRLVEAREQRQNGTPYHIVVSSLSELTALGEWLDKRATTNRLDGIRLVATNDPFSVLDKIKDKLEAVHESAIIRMPLSPEVDAEEVDYKYFYTISPSLRATVKLCKELAENKIWRIYLLGGPGTGKTSLAYYYWLCRGAGNFVAVNLNAESTGDKAQMKSLLCGHVTGAFPGAAAREGAFSFARDGVCFLDESHGVTGVVMQVLMEALDSGQFLPLGATKKRPVECAVIFASNRSWEDLRSRVNLDEHARLGATIVAIKDLTEREEDLIAVLATHLYKFSTQCTTWTPPKGVTEDAWARITNCAWTGNIRTLIRVSESACIAFGSQHCKDELIGEEHLTEALSLWEPEEHESMQIYTSYK